MCAIECGVWYSPSSSSPGSSSIRAYGACTGAMTSGTVSGPRAVALRARRRSSMWSSQRSEAKRARRSATVSRARAASRS